MPPDPPTLWFDRPGRPSRPSRRILQHPPAKDNRRWRTARRRRHHRRTSWRSLVAPAPEEGRTTAGRRGAAAAQQQPQQPQQQQQQQEQRRQQRRPSQQRTLQFQRINGPPAAVARADAVSARLNFNSACTCDVHASNECRPGSARGCTCRCSCGASAAQNAGRGGVGRARDNPTPPGNRGSNISNRQRRPGTSGEGQRLQPRRPRPGCDPQVVVSRPIPAPTTPLGGRRHDESNNAPTCSHEHGQIGATLDLYKLFYSYWHRLVALAPVSFTYAI